jgi:hypothetical protein
MTNTSLVTLTNVTLVDTNYDLSTCEPIDQLGPNESYQCIIGPFPAEIGQHTNTATVIGEFEGIIYEDSDDANYFGFEFTPTGLIVGPANTTLTPGQRVAFEAWAYDGETTIRNVTLQTAFAIESAARGLWRDNVYTGEGLGSWRVSAQFGDLTGVATLRTVRYTVYVPFVSRGE